MVDRIGQLLGNYRLVRHLGKGGFAGVYLGEHRYLKNYAALKVLHVSPTLAEGRHFLSEAQTLAQMDHPNIVRIRDFAVEHETPFLVMDYVPGGTVRKLYPAGTRLPLATAVSYIKQIASALQFAHNMSIIHRDVKPENILFRTEQHVLLSDFGLALFAPAPDLLSTQEHAGTIFYMSPEQLRGKPQFATDQYALGVIAYEWLCGIRPFEGKAWHEIAFKHYSGQPRPLREICPDLPAAAETVVLKALAKEPQERYPNVQQFANALERACSQHLPEGEGPWIIKLPTKSITPGPGLSQQLPSGQVFLSYPSADPTSAFAKRLKSDLSKRGVIFANDYTYDAIQGPGAENAVRQAIRAARLVLVVVTSSTRSSQTVKEHLRLAVMYQRHLVLVWASGEDKNIIDSLRLGVPGQDRVIDARGSRYPRALDEIIENLQEKTEESDFAEGAPTQPAVSMVPRNPYKGLHAFGSQDARDFFGRGRLINELAQRLQTLTRQPPQIPGSRLLAIVGPSGSGKSSVLKAGLLPKLQHGVLADVPGSEQWLYLNPITPGRRPCDELLNILARQFPQGSLSSIGEEVAEESGRGLHRLAVYLNRRHGAYVVLVIDQFEEVFSEAVSEAERQHFLNLITTAATEPGGPILILLTLRADFYDRPMQYPELSRLIEANHVPVLPMELEDLRAVIEEPAALSDVRLSFEGNLVGDLLFEAQGQAGFLPLLEFTLDQLFQQREGHWLTLLSYKNIKGVKGALVEHAEDVYNNQLPSQEHREMARILFLRLIDPGTGVQDATRRRASMAELVRPDPKQTAIMSAVADIFVAQRLLMAGEHNGENTIEVSHEALITQWTRLANWLREAREDIIRQHAISADSTEWQRRGRSVDHLYRGSKLVEAQDWAGRNPPNQDEEAFLRASAEEQKRRETQERRRQRRVITALSIFLLIVIVLGGLAGISSVNAKRQALIASIQATRATDAAQQSESRELALEAKEALANKETDLALLLSVKALQVQNTAEARNSLFDELMQSPHLAGILSNGYDYPPNYSGHMLSLTFSQKGQTLYAYNGFQIFHWDVQSHKDWPIGLPSSVVPESTTLGTIAFSPDGRTLGIVNSNGIWLVNLPTTSTTPTTTLRSSLAGSLPGISSTTNVPDNWAITFSPNGTLVAASRCHAPLFSTDQPVPPCSLNTVSIWNTHSGQPTLFSFTVNADVVGLAFSSDGTRLAIASSTNIVVVNTATSQQIVALPIGKAALESLAFSSDGTRLAAGSKNGIIYLWDSTSGNALGSFMGHQGAVWSIAFSHNGKMLASAGQDGTVRLWNVGALQELGLPLTGHPGEVLSLVFSSNDEILASGGDDGSLLLWDVNSKGSINQRLADALGAHSPLLSPDGRTIFVGTDDGNVLLLDSTTGELQTTLSDMSAYPPSDSSLTPIESLAVSDNGKILAAGRVDGTILLWNLDTKKVLPVSPLKGPVSPSGGILSKVVLSADGHLLAAAGDGGVVMLWDISRQSKASVFPVPSLPGVGASMALSSDGKLLAASGKCAGSCQVSLWEVGTNKPLTPALAGQQNTFQDLAFSPDGRTLAASSSSGIELWDMTKRSLITTLAVPSTVPDLYSLLFSDDGQQLLASTGFGSPTFAFMVWNVPQRELLVQPFPETANPNSSETFSQGGITFGRDSQHLISVFTHNGTNIVLLWNIAPSAWQQRGCDIAHRNLTQAEWNLYVKDEPHRSQVCTGFPLDA